MGAISPGRIVAFEVLRKVASSGLASDLLRSRSAALDRVDAGLANELVFGVLRFERQLDFLTSYFSGRDANEFDLEVRLAFRLGIYQLRHLDRIPPHAAVGESVELVKQAGKPSAAGLVNAVLRKVDRRLIRWPSWDIELSHPEWLLDNWRRLFGEKAARQIAKAFLAQPDAFIRVPTDRRSEARDLAMEETDLPGCFRFLGRDPRGFRRQDYSSQMIVPMLGLEPGNSFLDLCAAPGNKTAQAVEIPLFAVACDVSLRRLAEVNAPGVMRVNLDATAPLPFARQFERILLDVPCSGTGTIGRNPEIKWRIQPEDLVRQHARQVRLLENALSVLAAGGRLVYSTCSLEYEENEQVIEEVLDRQPPDIILEEQVRRLPGIHRGDGFFAASIVRAPDAGDGA